MICREGMRLGDQSCPIKWRATAIAKLPKQFQLFGSASNSSSASLERARVAKCLISTVARYRGAHNWHCCLPSRITMIHFESSNFFSGERGNFLRVAASTALPLATVASWRAPFSIDSGQQRQEHPRKLSIANGKRGLVFVVVAAARAVCPSSGRPISVVSPGRVNIFWPGRFAEMMLK